ncbi:hypothetical protein DFH07DRAFT_782273 [Mycena maculata]|uniref:Uncharacterized protein n=1 Tax=Mycena maculata TaxID=230809 RepID=A0AAD7MR06_9AGAR|nr:hypothetical protein DFH07DRAFT_782273 [Mycena maculata]
MSVLKQLAASGEVIADAVSRLTMWDWMRTIRQSDSLQVTATNLNSLAIIATFLAAVQAQVINFSLMNNATAIQTACNTFFLAGLLVDVLSGTIAIVGSIQLQLRNTRRLPETGNRQAQLALVHHIRLLGRVIFPLLHSPRLWSAFSQKLNESADLIQQIMDNFEFEDSLRIILVYSLADYRHTTNRLASSRFWISLVFAAHLTVPPLVVGGLCCFTAGTLCLVLDSQPIPVWATSFGVLGGIILLVLAMIIGFDIHPAEPPFRDVYFCNNYTVL